MLPTANSTFRYAMLSPSSVAIKTLLNAHGPLASRGSEVNQEITHIENLKRTVNQFAEDPNYQLVKGNSYHGVVVIYPQAHYVKKIYEDKNGNNEIKRTIYLSQKSIYQDFLLQKPEHIYNEGMRASQIRFLKEEATRIDLFKHILFQLNNNVELSEDEQEVFVSMGGAIFYALSCLMHDVPIKLHATMSEQDFIRLQAILSGSPTSHFSSVDSATYDFLFRYMEEKVADVVMQTAAERNGKPAFIVYGFEHKFDTAFSRTDSPALYRRL